MKEKPNLEFHHPSLATRRCGPLALAAPARGSRSPLPRALAGSGGIGGPGSGGGGGSSGPAGKAKLKNGLAVAPSNAPRRVEKVIDAANKIAKGKDYCYGGGHGSFNDNCYDCSGAVSYALHGGDFRRLADALRQLPELGQEGQGQVDHCLRRTSDHAYAVIAGLRFDTSMTSGEGPGWSKDMRSSSGFTVRHPNNF